MKNTFEMTTSLNRVSNKLDIAGVKKEYWTWRHNKRNYPKWKEKGKKTEKEEMVLLNYGITSSCLIYIYLEAWKKRRVKGQKKMIETIMAKAFQIFLKLVI